MSPEFYLRRSFELALKAQGQTWPNPLVGAVIVKEGRIIGEGFHAKAGEAHAEVAALNSCKESPRGAVIYVNLEPCCHTNKLTPPCAQRLIQEGIQKVVISNLDPNPAVNGKGVELLRQNGIEVEHGTLKEEGERLNEAFFTSQRLGRPFIHLKLATSLDGKMALPSGESKWITGEKAREHVHQLRALHQAVAVGAGTVRKDDPKLNVRLPGYKGPDPYRVVFSKSGKLPSVAQLLTDELKEKTLIYPSLEEGMEDLFKRKIITLFVEGGPRLAAGLLSKKMVDRVGLYLNPSFIGEGLSALEGFSVGQLAERPRLTHLESSWIGEDLYLTGKVLHH